MGKTMSDYISEEELIDVRNTVDSEFEAIRKANVFHRSTDSLFSRVDTLSAKQFELKSLLESLDAQLKQAEDLQLQNSRVFSAQEEVGTSSASVLVTPESSTGDKGLPTRVNTATHEVLPPRTSSRSESTERRVLGGGKDSPIVIDDEDEIAAVSTDQNTGRPSQVTEIATLDATAQAFLPSFASPTLLNNVRRRPLIIEKITESQGYGLEPTLSSDRGGIVSSANAIIDAPRPLTNEVREPVTAATLPANTSASVAVHSLPVSSVNGGNGSSTESASSSFNDRSQSPAIVMDVLESYEVNDNVTSGSSALSKSNPVADTEKILSISQSSKTRNVPSRRPHSPSDFKVGSRVLGKRSSDIWFPGEIIKTMPDKRGQTKYSVKYDKGQKGVLSLHHICPEAPAIREELCVGSRVVGLYGRLDIWYAGIVAELPCPDNRNRFLIFFDDGFAQYLYAKKLHKVHHKGKNVWDDVAEHSRDFIQEYLEDYPSRPMLHVWVGQWIRTEWKGQWLKAKVLSVDGSLVKMLFQIDNRSEWIYRGSTRLDPLYRALVLGEKSKSSKGRSRKLTRSTPSKANAPYIEYNITKLAFGISPYSKTDPKGIQQLELEEQRKMTAQQQQQQQQPRHNAKYSKESSGSTDSKQTKKLAQNTSHDLKQKEESLSESRRSERIVFGSNKKQDDPVASMQPVIESTYSCIQASSLRKKTGASLVNNIIFKANDVAVQEMQILPTAEKPPIASVAPLPSLAPSEKPVDQKRSRGKSAEWKAPWLNLDQRNKQRHAAESVVKQSLVLASKPRDVAAILKNKLDASSVDEKKDFSSETSSVSSFNSESVSTITAGPHACSSACGLRKSEFSFDPLRHNPLAMPILQDWKREIVKRRGKTNKRDVYYRTPCHRRLRNLAEVFQYLRLTEDPNLHIDQFTFDWRVRTKDMITSTAIVDDMSNEVENRPIPAVNAVDNDRPPDVKYVRERQLAPGVELSKDPGFMVCCDCDDSCSDSAKCACIQLTLQGSKAVDGKDYEKSTYHYRRLRDCVQTGIYECNSRCSCSKRCLNRVVQNGIQMRMEIFKTENRGWGLRAVDDIPAGTFICTYAGYLLNEELANQDGRDYGDEYMAELDYIEVAEKAKEGYESGVSDLEEDDTVINEMLQSDEHLSDSDNSDLEDEGEDSDDEHDDEDGDDDDDDDNDDEDDDEDEDDNHPEDDDRDNNHADMTTSSDENCSMSSGDESSLGQRRKTLRSSKRKVFKSEQKKKRGTVSEESMVVEREYKAKALLRLADPLMCVLALKRNDNDVGKSARFLQKVFTGQKNVITETIITGGRHDAPVNGLPTQAVNETTGVGSGQPALLCNSDFDLDELSDETLEAIHGRKASSMSRNKRTLDEKKRGHAEEHRTNAKESESREGDKSTVAKVTRVHDGLTMETRDEKDDESTRTDAAKEDNFKIPKNDDVPELLSADDLKRLAASEPKSMEPPVLLKAREPRRGSVLDEMIEKLKKRVVSSDSNFSKAEMASEKVSNSEIVSNCENKSISVKNTTSDQTTTFANISVKNEKPDDEMKLEPSSAVASLKKEVESFSGHSRVVGARDEDAVDDDKRSIKSESSSLSRNSSSVTQSASNSRCSSPSTDLSSTATKDSGKISRKRKVVRKDKKFEAESSLLAKHVKTRSLFGEEHCYVIDAKTFGNCGRFLNHSCSPNLFVQNVFVDTHDLRFPRVAFFAQHNIRAGSELCWDYMYEVGSVHNKFLYCLCGSSECRGRLL